MSPISVHAFVELLDRLGPDLGQWPADLADAAHLVLKVDSAARLALANAQQLTLALAQLPLAQPAAAALSERILRSHPLLHSAPQSVPQRSGWRGVLDSLGQFWEALGGTRLAGPVLAAGMLLGGLTPYWATPDEGAAATEDQWLVAAQLDEAWTAADLEIEP